MTKVVTARTQKRQAKAAASAKVAAEARIDEVLASATTKRKRTTGVNITADDIIRERDERGLSWKQVAINLDLGSPGHARTLYTKLTGKDHHESQMTGKRARRGSGSSSNGSKRKSTNPGWNDDSDQDEIIQALQGEWIPATEKAAGHYRGSDIVVRRSLRNGPTFDESVRVNRIDKFAFDGKNEDGPLVVHVHTSGGFRCFRVADIVEVHA